MSARDESISTRDYTRLCDLIYAEAGIHLGSEKKTMLEVRVKRRLKALDLGSYDQYCDYLFGRQGLKEEIVSLIDVVTTNKTDFFREPGAFQFSGREGASGTDFARRRRKAVAGLERRLLDRRGALHAGHGAQRVCADPSRLSLQDTGHRYLHHRAREGEMGVYSNDVVSPVPAALKRKYLMAAAIEAPTGCGWCRSCAAWSSFAA